MSSPTTNGTQKPSDTATSTSPPPSSIAPTATAITTAVSSPPPVSPKAVQHIQPLAPAKLPTLAPQTQLAGTVALAANKRQNQAQNKTSQDSSKASEKPASPDNKTSVNPATQIFATYPMSKPSDAPPPQNTSPTSADKRLAVLPSIATAANAMDASNSSPSTAGTTTTTGSLSNGTAAEGGAPTVTAGPTNTTDPALLQPQDNNHHYQPIAAQQTPRTGSLPEALSATTPTTPGFGQNATTPTTPFSPPGTTPGGRGKHTCPHCQQTFTRHHNLKSHLLTHSHEKPFLCNQCQSRFRRLHDLKRHSKLHTGERPHMCTKCGRKFARGDALARHARAEGGCAGRRSSMAGSMNEDGTLVSGFENDDGMEGLEGLIDGDPDGDVDMIGGGGGGGGGDAGQRRRSLPSIRTDFSGTQNATGGQGAAATGGYAHSHGGHHTYPPLNTPNRTASTSGPSPASGLFPPPPPHTGGLKPNTPLSAQSSATPVSGGAGGTGSILSPHGVITDSPRASSPANMQNQPESSASDRNNSFFNLSGLQAATQAQPSHGGHRDSVGAPTANMGTNMFAGSDPVWAYIRGLEARINEQAAKESERTAKIAALEAKVAALERQQQQPQQPQQPPAPTAATVSPAHSPQQQTKTLVAGQPPAPPATAAAAAS